MKTIGAFEAKTHLSSLLDRVEKGESITITKHGRPAALLIPASVTQSISGDSLVEKFAAFRAKQKKQSRSERKSWVDEGRP